MSIRKGAHFLSISFKFLQVWKELANIFKNHVRNKDY